jgi:GT2 family glycosyltransferase
MISYLLPTRNRPDRLAATLAALGRLSVAAHGPAGGAEVLVVDDASAVPVEREPVLRNGMPVRVIRRRRREGAAARNAAAIAARGEWIVMLDDDSHPLDEAVVDVVADAAEDVAAIGAEILLPDGRHEDGGLPEVFVGCGAAIRRRAFLQLGGYDPSFHYYAEEYDLCARLLQAGWRIIHDWRLRVRHDRDAAGRDMNTILHRLVRNNGWVMQRYAPEAQRQDALNEVIGRYRRIAETEEALVGYEQGLAELNATLASQPRRPMDEALWDRFTGLAHARAALHHEPALRAQPVAIVDEGKNAWVIRRALNELAGCRITDERDAQVGVIGTMSPGPMMDAWAQRRHEHRAIVRPWRMTDASVADRSRVAVSPPA